ncbi:MAG: septum site-determining protein MinC [Firmicutes bacterium]|nr:septum site-determining protein MinC [Bacillota bacterium]
MPAELVSFRGSNNGLCIFLNCEESLGAVLEQLTQKLMKANGFFTGAPVTVCTLGRLLSPDEFRELVQLITVTFHLRLVAVDQRTEEELKKNPLSVWYDHMTRPPGEMEAAGSGHAGGERAGRSTSQAGARGAAASRQEREGARSSLATLETERAEGEPGAEAITGSGIPRATLLLKRTLRSGQDVRFDGNVVVLGDVNPGAEIVASGDIVVLGHLRGVAHAGARGDRRAVVAAFRLSPTQLRIADFIGRAPDGKIVPPNAPEVARIRDDAVVIEQYLG